jgi:hypothetical protein
MPKCALPPHLQSKLHNDWPFPLNRLPRAINAKGPRCLGSACECGGEGYLPWPPKLVKGYGVARWETTGATSIVYVPEFRDRLIGPADLKGKRVAIERNDGPQLGQRFEVDLIEAGYSPSSLQLYSDKGWMELDPFYKTWHRVLKRDAEGNPVEGRCPNWRVGWRVDHLDMYYNFGPFAGLNFE